LSKSVIWILHILYWALFLLLLMIFFTFIAMVPGFEKVTADKQGAFSFWMKLMSGFAIIPAVIAFYSGYTFLFEKLLSKRKFLLFIAGGLAMSLAGSICGAMVESIPFFFGPKYLFGDGIHSALTIIIIMTLAAFVNCSIGAVIKGFISWYNDIKLKESLLTRNFEMELNLVKMQINPHFLFNTLNNIDVLIEKDPAKASDYFKKLSHILRFMLYETKTEKIPLSKELVYIEKYLELQQLRNSNPAFVDFKIAGKPDKIMAEPMLFIPFIENAFKHANNKKEVNGICIYFKCNANEIDFVCENSFDELAEKDRDGGLGNELIEKRLNLMYPGRHVLTISTTENRYRVHLIIQLSA
jgi:two-component system, LytTR family, sensor kinase